MKTQLIRYLVIAFFSAATAYGAPKIIIWDFWTQSTVPARLTNVVAISAGLHHKLALKADGHVVAWGGIGMESSTNVPPGLSGVVAIAAGDNHNLALKSNGKVIAWGYNFEGQTNVPRDSPMW
jgi:alpha-tubulin suppressor-like RCC1 family protein